MHLWKYFCVLCQQNIEEYHACGGRRIKAGVCPSCARAAVRHWSGENFPMTTCEPCFANGKNVTALRFVPVGGRNVPMCEKCWGGGAGPGLSYRSNSKPTLAEKAATAPVVHEAAAPPVAKLPPAIPATELHEDKCGCGRDADHRGRCSYRRNKSGSANHSAASFQKFATTPALPSGPTAVILKDCLAHLLTERTRLKRELEKIDGAIEAIGKVVAA